MGMNSLLPSKPRNLCHPRTLKVFMLDEFGLNIVYFYGTKSSHGTLDAILDLI